MSIFPLLAPTNHPRENVLLGEIIFVRKLFKLKISCSGEAVIIFLNFTVIPEAKFKMAPGRKKV